MFRATIGYFAAVPSVALIFWLLAGVFAPPASPTPLISVLFSAVFFTPLLLLQSIPGLLVLLIWAALFSHRAWFIASLLASSIVLLLFAYANQVMCRIAFFGSDCWGHISFQLTERSPFTAEYPMVFWSTVACTLVFWLAFFRASRSRQATSEHTHERLAGDASQETPSK
jgi:hypothetical protein